MFIFFAFFILTPDKKVASTYAVCFYGNNPMKDIQILDMF